MKPSEQTSHENTTGFDGITAAVIVVIAAVVCFIAKATKKKPAAIPDRITGRLPGKPKSREVIKALDAICLVVGHPTEKTPTSISDGITGTPLGTAIKVLEAICIVAVVADAAENSPTLHCYILRKLHLERCKAVENPALHSATDNTAVPEFRGALLSWLATVASDYWPEPSRAHVNCGCAAFERRSVKTATPSHYSPPSSPPPPKLRCRHCNSTSNVVPDIGNPREGLCQDCYADLDSHVGVIHG
jgi:hypothetical protein